jgi:hypothetical protein
VELEKIAAELVMTTIDPIEVYKKFYYDLNQTGNIDEKSNFYYLLGNDALENADRGIPKDDDRLDEVRNYIKKKFGVDLKYDGEGNITESVRGDFGVTQRYQLGQFLFSLSIARKADLPEGTNMMIGWYFYYYIFREVLAVVSEEVLAGTRSYLEDNQKLIEKLAKFIGIAKTGDPKAVSVDISDIQYKLRNSRDEYDGIPYVLDNSR